MALRFSKEYASLTACLVMMCGQAWADPMDINFAGFASLVYGKTITDDAKEGVMNELSNEGEYRDFNKLGFRMDVDMHNNLTFTAQVLALGKDNYDPSFDWIFATYHFDPEWALSAGRVRVPIFMFSDYLDTSYAYPWLEPPKAVYNLEQTPFKSIEGLSLSYTTNMGEWTSEWQLFGGKGNDRFTEQGIDSDLVLEHAIGTSWMVGYEWLSLRAFYFQATSTLDLTTNPLIAALMSNVSTLEAGLASIPGAGRNLHDALLWERDPGEFFGLGGSLDFERFFVISELTQIDLKGKDSNMVAPEDMNSFYLTGGVRLPADWTLSLTYSRDVDHADKRTYRQFNPTLIYLNGLNDYLAALPTPTPQESALLAALPGVIDNVRLLQAGIANAVRNQQNYGATGWTLSGRWDFHPSASLKVEYLFEDRSGDYAQSAGMDKPQALRLGLDLVF